MNFTTNDLALGHLPSLQSVIARLYNRKDAEEVKTEVKETLRHESDVHPNHPSIHVDTYTYRWIRMDSTCPCMYALLLSSPV